MNLIRLFMLLSILFIQKGCGQDVYLRYHSATWNIEIKNDSLLARKTEYIYGNTPSATPQGSTFKEYSRKLSKQETDSLLQMLTSREFQNLKEEYGVSEEQRFYPYELQVKYKNTEKNIIYRSSPLTSEKPPEIFTKITNFMVKLCE